MLFYALVFTLTFASADSVRAATDSNSLSSDRLSDRFGRWLDDNAPSLAVDRQIGGRLNEADRSAWIEHALQALSPEFCAALDQFDHGDYAAAIDGFRMLQGNSNPYVAAYAQYYLARARIAAGLLEEAETQLKEALIEEESISEYSPFVLDMRLLLAHVQFANLRYDDSAKTLALVENDTTAAREYLRTTARQLGLEIERREKGTLAEVAAFMDYSADRLEIKDSGARVRSRQDEIVAMLDKMIQEKEQQEQQQQSSSSRQGSRQRGKAAPNATPNPNDGRAPPKGKGEIGDLHAAPKADPGEAWGTMPPAEREKVLERLKERYPARYRQLVEQFYRSMAEER